LDVLRLLLEDKVPEYLNSQVKILVFFLLMKLLMHWLFLFFLMLRLRLRTYGLFFCHGPHFSKEL
jgi:hypothetical protein